MEQQPGNNNPSGQEENLGDGTEMKDISQTNNNVEQLPPFQPAPKPATPEEEKQIVKQLDQQANQDGLKAGDTYYVISARWLRQWKEYVSYDWSKSYETEKPGVIDNDTIIEPGEPGDDRIRRNCMENYDFIVVSREIWLTLQSWYGGGPALPRKVIATGWHGTSLVVEIRPLYLRVCKSSNTNDFVNATFSKADTIQKFKEVMCQKLELNHEDVRVWDFHGMSRYKLLEEMTVKLDSAQIIDGQPMMLEEKGPDGKWPEAPKVKSYTSYSYSSHGGPCDPGTSGLINLGNTCFMNSSLQCLSNTAPLTQYFLADKYKPEINADNPLGMKGELAEEYATLVKDIWSGTNSAIAPRDFKWKLERFAPQFAGYQQHDSQELLAFLLDGLHEDLNRIKKKPYIENPEYDGSTPEEDVAKKAWELHKSRNDSIIVDWFQGQLKSTLVCPKCSRTSVTFDPFMYLSLPMPMKMTRTINVHVFFADPTKKATKYAVEAPKYGTIQEMKKVLSGMCKVDAGALIVFDVFNSKFFKQLTDKESVDVIQDRDFIWAYEIQTPQSESETVHYFPVMIRKDAYVTSTYYYSSRSYQRKLFGIPFLISVKDPQNLTYDRLYELLYSYVKRYLKGMPSDKVVKLLGDLAPTSGAESTTTTVETNMESATTVPGGVGNVNMPPVNAKNEDSSDEDEPSSTNTAPGTGAPVPHLNPAQMVQPFFTIYSCDSNGNSDAGPLRQDLTIELEDRAWLCVHFGEDVAEHYYDENLEKDFQIDDSCNKGEEKEEENVSLTKCLEMFTTTEQLGPDDPWYCSKCKEFVQATKKFDLWKLPPVLVIHLKRFSYKNKYWREKLETFVDYPGGNTDEFLDLTPWAKGKQEKEPLYQLYAVSNHFGSLGGGHYIAHAKNQKDNKWYRFDDSSVGSVETNKAKSNSAYVLFFQRKDTIGQNNNNATTTTTTTTTATTEQGKAENDMKLD